MTKDLDNVIAYLDRDLKVSRMLNKNTRDINMLYLLLGIQSFALLVVVVFYLVNN